MNENFGINMKKYCRDHEEMVKKAEPSAELLAHHLEMIKRIQHERLVHLVVTVMVVIGELFALDLVLLHPETHPYSAIFMLGLAILLIFYFYHYFFLENTVQRWYRIADDLRKGITNS